eukprot:371842-Rhodomonas_salina.6
MMTVRHANSGWRVSLACQCRLDSSSLTQPPTKLCSIASSSSCSLQRQHRSSIIDRRRFPVDRVPVR